MVRETFDGVKPCRTARRLIGVSPRKNRRQVDKAAERGSGRVERTESDASGDWIVRPVAAANATKPYRCPGCDQEIPVGVTHLVAWRADGPGAEDRRHWHASCWRARGRRAPRVQRSRGAPRY